MQHSVRTLGEDAFRFGHFTERHQKLRTPFKEKYQQITMNQCNAYRSGMCNAWSDTSAGGWWVNNELAVSGPAVTGVDYLRSTWFAARLICVALADFGKNMCVNMLVVVWVSTAVFSPSAEHTGSSTSLLIVPSTLAPNGPVLLIESVSCHWHLSLQPPSPSHRILRDMMT